MARDNGVNNLTCAANDVSVARVSVLNNVTSCTAGEMVTLRLAVDLDLNANTRYDIGVYTALDGGDGRTGMCAVSVLPIPPAINASGDNDACGDISRAISPLRQVEIQEVTVPCVTDANGKLKVSSNISWDNNRGTTCNSAANAFPSSPSKCYFQGALPLDIPVLNALTVIKDTQPDSGQDFTFTATGTGLTNFTLDDDVDAALANRRTFVNLTNGSYIISEDAMAGWNVSQITCVNQNNQPIGTIDLANRRVTLNLQGAHATCTFANQQQPPGRLVIQKTVTQAAGSDSPPAGFAFDFALTGGASPQNFTLTGGGQTTYTLSAGVYGVSESINDPITGRWTQTAATCSDGSPLTAIDLASGETVTCTFTNQYNFQKLNLTSDCPSGIFRVTNPNSYAVNYRWDVVGTALQGIGIAAPGSNFNAFNTGQTQGTVRLFVNNVLNNTKATRINCVNLTVIKEADPANGADFTFNLAKSTAQGALPNSITLDDAAPDDGDAVSQRYQRSDLYAGVYTITETLPTHWVLSQTGCTANRGVADGTGVSLSLNDNDNVTCTFTNTLSLGKIIISKATDPAEASQPFTFTTSYGPTFRLTDGESNDSGPLLPGAYAITETLPSGWQQSSVVCADGSTLAALDLAGGETLTCTVTNTLQRGRIVVQKETIPAEVMQTFTFTTDYAGAITLASGATHTSDPLLPGLYTVDEINIPRGWSKTGAACSNGNDPSAITLTAGKIITCTFVNTAQPAGIALEKSVDQSSIISGTGVTYSYTVTNQGQAPLSNVLLDDDRCAPLTYGSGDDADNYLEVGEAWLYTCAATLIQDTLNTAMVSATTPLNQVVNAVDKVFVDVRPGLLIHKSATPNQVVESGAAVRFSLVITNPNLESVTLDSLNDSIFGNLNGQGDCAIAQSIAPQTSYTCAFTQTLTGDAGITHSNIVTATASDDEENPVSASATATVTFSDLLPAVELSKNPTPISQVEPAAPFTFTLTLRNTAAETVTVMALTDDYPLSAQCDGLLATALAPAASVSCQYSVTLTTPGQYTNTATVEVADNEENGATAITTATVTVIDLPASLQVEKRAAAPTLHEPGGDMDFTVLITNTSAVDNVTLTTLIDDIDNNGDADVFYTATTICLATALAPGDATTCTFRRFLVGNPGDLLTDVITVAAVDDDQQPVTESDDATVVITGLGSSLAMSKTPSPATLPEPGGSVVFHIAITNTSPVDSVTINALNDSLFNDITTTGHDNIIATTCTTPQALATNGASYRCSFTVHISGNAADIHENIAVANGIDSDRDAVTGVANATVNFTNIPSALTVSKTANPSSVPESGAVITYTVVVTNSSLVDVVTVNQVVDDRFGDVGASCLPALPAKLAPQAAVRCTFARLLQQDVGTTHTNTVTANGLDDDGQALSQQASATVSFSDTPANMAISKEATPNRVPESGANVQFQVTITNTSAADAITIERVGDDRFGDVSAGCSPALPTPLQPGHTLHCSFARFLAGDVALPHVNTVMVEALDDDGGSLSALAQATVSFSDQPALLTLSKTPSPAVVPVEGAVVSFTVQAANPSPADTLTLTRLDDSIYGNVADTANLRLSGTNCRLPQELARDASYTCQFAAFIRGAVGDRHENTLTVSGSDDDEAAVSATAQATVLVAAPLVAATKSVALVIDNAGDGLASPDDVLEYTVVIHNTGNAPAQNLIFNDLIEANTTLLADSVTTNQGAIVQGNRAGDNAVTVELGDLAANRAVTIRFRVRIVTPLPPNVLAVRNQGISRGNNFPTTPTDDPQTPTPLDETVTPVVAAPRLTALKTDRLFSDADNDGRLTPGDTLEYRISLRNSGTQDALAAFVNDTLDPNVQLVVGSVTTSQGQVTSGNQPGATTVTVDLGTLAGGGGAAVITFRVTINNPLPVGVTTVANQGVLSGSNFPTLRSDDPDTPVLGDPTQSPLALTPAIETFKTGRLLIDSDKNGGPTPGDTLVYNITLINRGNITATQVLFSDTPDAQTTLVNGTVQSTQGTIRQGNNQGDQQVVIDLGAIPAGAQATITLHVLINRLAETSVNNQATVTFTNPLDPTAAPFQNRSNDPITPGPPDPTRVLLISPSALEESDEPGRVHLFMPLLQR